MKIVRVTAMWCMSCLAMKRVWKKVLKDIDIVDIDFDESPEQVEKLGIGKILPELIVYIGDLEVARIIGEKSKKEMQRIISEINEKN